MLGGKVDAADKGDNAVHDHSFTVQTAKDVSSHAHDQRTRIVIDKAHARLRQTVDITLGQLGGAVAIDHHFDLDAALRRRQQHLVQGVAHIVFEQDKDFQQYAVFGT